MVAVSKVHPERLDAIHLANRYSAQVEVELDVPGALAEECTLCFLGGQRHVDALEVLRDGVQTFLEGAGLLVSIAVICPHISVLSVRGGI